MSRTMLLLISIFVILIGITVWSLIDKEPPSLVKPIASPGETSLTEKRKLIALWDSLTAWYQLPPEKSFPAQLQKLFTKAGMKITVINAGKSGDTSSQMRERLDRSLEETSSWDILLLTAGANDGLQWLPLDQLEANLVYMITQAQERGLIVILWWMKLPRNYWSEYTTAFDDLYPKVAETTDALLIPFLLENVATVPTLNLSDGIHPNASGYALVAQQVFDFFNEYIWEKSPEM